jgi:SynChlorMet cassette protein ScmD
MEHLDKLLIANPQTVFREEFDSWAILFDPDSGKAFGMNPVAVQIWKSLDGRHKIEDIERDIEESFSDIPEQFGSDIRDFLKQLVDMGFAGYEA